MTDEQPTTPQSEDEHRAAVVAGIRALADLIETNTSLPVPSNVTAQYSIMGDLDEQGRQLVRDAAAQLGIEPEMTAYRATAHFSVASNKPPAAYFRVDYIVFGNKPEPEQAEAGDPS
jgi:hypothetical protein